MRFFGNFSDTRYCNKDGLDLGEQVLEKSDLEFNPLPTRRLDLAFDAAP